AAAAAAAAAAGVPAAPGRAPPAWVPVDPVAVAGGGPIPLRPAAAAGFAPANAAAVAPAAAPLGGSNSWHSQLSLHLRLAALVLVTAVAMVVAAALGYHVPVLCGRAAFVAFGLSVGNDLYCSLAGCVLTWGMWLAAGAACAHANAVLRRGRAALGTAAAAVAASVAVAAKWLVILSLWLAALPLMIGSVAQAVTVIPLRVPAGETPLLAPAQVWALGLVLLKVWMRCVTIGGFGGGGGAGGGLSWRRRLDRVRRNGVWGVNFTETMRDVVLPALNSVGEFYFMPLMFAKGLLPLTFTDPVRLAQLQRLTFPAFVGLKAAAAAGAAGLQFLQSCHDSIRDEMYLLGTQLRNADAITEG
ncbi:unnamed protein product, partial [Phaeothamnion confervicola]